MAAQVETRQRGGGASHVRRLLARGREARERWWRPRGWRLAEALPGATLSLAAAHIERCLAAVWWALSGADLGSILVRKVGPLIPITGSSSAVSRLLAWLNKGGGP
jgi:hypothetical protein